MIELSNFYLSTEAMKRGYIVFAFLILTFSCKGQNVLNKEASQKYFEEGAQMVIKSIQAFGDTNAFISLNRKAIEKFELAYQYDSTYERVWEWFPYSYYFSGEYEKAIYWSKRVIQLERTDSIRKGDAYRFVGLSYLYLGNLDVAQSAIESAIRFYKGHDTGIVELIEAIKGAAIQIQNKQELFQITNAQRTSQSSCTYSLKVFEYALNLYRNHYDFLLPSDEIRLKTWIEDCK